MAETRLGSLINNRVVAFDTSILIYYLEGSERYTPLIDEFFERLFDRQFRALASMLVIAELLVGQYKKHELSFGVALRERLSQFDQLKIIAVDWPTAEQAARLRARQSSLSLPDALHLATALQEEADLFLTNDRRLKVVKALRVVTLRELA